MLFDLKLRLRRLLARYSRRKLIVKKDQYGVTLIELIVFITVSGIIILALSTVFRQAMTSLAQPSLNAQMLDMAYSQLNTVLSHSFDESSSSTNMPCDFALPCTGIGLDSGESLSNLNTLDDVDDFNSLSDIPRAGFSRNVSVSYGGALVGITNLHAKRIDVRVLSDSSESVIVTAYKVNY